MASAVQDIRIVPEELTPAVTAAGDQNAALFEHDKRVGAVQTRS